MGLSHRTHILAKHQVNQSQRNDLISAVERVLAGGSDALFWPPWGLHTSLHTNIQTYIYLPREKENILKITMVIDSHTNE